MNLRTTTFRSQVYLDWVKTQPSVVSGKSPCVAHHIKVPGFGGTLKCSDLFTIPLTWEEHAEFHSIGWQSWEAANNIDQMVAALRTIERAFAQGILQETE